MSFASLLDHRVYIRRDVDSGAEDGQGQPITVSHRSALFPAAIQPKTVRDVALISSAGVVIGDTTIYVQPRVLTEADAIIHDTALCPKPDEHDLPTGRYELTGVRNETGRGHHLALDAILVGSGDLGVEGS